MPIFRSLLLFICFTFNSLNAVAETRISIDIQDTGPVIDRNIYGHFIEHLGRVIYDGLWVGYDSAIPNTRGWRDDAVQALRDIHVPVLRWPGGCFADTYHWRDGVGPVDERPTNVNILWGEIPETNAVGTHEYFDLIEQLGAEAYVNGNLGTGTPQEMADWVEYMTGSTDHGMAALRRVNGREKPFPLHHFGIGNESWGCGGGMTPEYYTSLYKQYSTFLRLPWAYPIKTQWIASGGHGYGDDVNAGGLTKWTDHLTANIQPDFLLGFNAVNFHYYTHNKGNALTEKGPAIGFTEQDWIVTLANTIKMDGYLAANRKVMDRNDPKNTIALYVDEWGAWYDPTPGTNPAYLEQKTTIRDAIITALNFHIFHKHAERVKMTSPAQMVNVLQAPLKTQGDKILLTPTYHAYKMYVPFHDATRLEIKTSGVPDYTLGQHRIPALSVTAAKSEKYGLTLALVNSDAQREHVIALELKNLPTEILHGEIMTADQMDAHNSFESPDVVKPKAVQIPVIDGRVELTLPAKSIMVLTQHPQ